MPATEKKLAEERQQWQLLEELNRLSKSGANGEQETLVKKRIGLLLGEAIHDISFGVLVLRIEWAAVAKAAVSGLL